MPRRRSSVKLYPGRGADDPELVSRVRAMSALWLQDIRSPAMRALEREGFFYLFAIESFPDPAEEPDKVLVDFEFLWRGASVIGGWSNRQYHALGAPWPPEMSKDRGNRTSRTRQEFFAVQRHRQHFTVIGNFVTREQAQAFLDLKDAHTDWPFAEKKLAFKLRRLENSKSVRSEYARDAEMQAECEARAYRELQEFVTELSGRTLRIA